jgi:hypothetical protein
VPDDIEWPLPFGGCAKSFDGLFRAAYVALKKLKSGILPRIIQVLRPAKEKIVHAADAFSPFEKTIS